MSSFPLQSFSFDLLKIHLQFRLYPDVLFKNLFCKIPDIAFIVLTLIVISRSSKYVHRSVEVVDNAPVTDVLNTIIQERERDRKNKALELNGKQTNSRIRDLHIPKLS